MLVHFWGQEEMIWDCRKEREDKQKTASDTRSILNWWHSPKPRVVLDQMFTSHEKKQSHHLQQTHVNYTFPKRCLPVRCCTYKKHQAPCRWYSALFFLIGLRLNEIGYKPQCHKPSNQRSYLRTPKKGDSSSLPKQLWLSCSLIEQFWRGHSTPFQKPSSHDEPTNYVSYVEYEVIWSHQIHNQKLPARLHDPPQEYTNLSHL